MSGSCGRLMVIRDKTFYFMEEVGMNLDSKLMPVTLLDYLSDAFQQAKSRGLGKRNTVAYATTRPLFEEDGLFFRIVSSRQDPSAPPEQAAGDHQTMADIFRAEFTAVWAHIPPADRKGMIARWRRSPCRGIESDPYCSNRQWPLILIVCDKTPSPQHAEIENDGYILTFPASLVQTPHVLRSEITRALAKVHHWATGNHWAQILRLWEEPLDKWDQDHKGMITDALQEEKERLLELELVRQHAASIDAIVAKWGFDAKK